MPVGSAVQALDLPDDPWYALALDLEELVEPGSSWDAEARQHALLEAALRLEQGDLP